MIEFCDEMRCNFECKRFGDFSLSLDFFGG